MPPAFNLSQDQTLQFNPTNTHNSLTVILITSMDFSIRVIAFNTFAWPKSLASRHPHLSVVQIVKDQRRAVQSNVSSRETRLWRTSYSPSSTSGKFIPQNTQLNPTTPPHIRQHLKTRLLKSRAFYTPCKKTQEGQLIYLFRVITPMQGSSLRVI